MHARGSSDNVLEQLGCRLTPCGLEIPPGLSFEQYLTALREVGKQRDTAFWRIGELWVYGDHRYGDRKALIGSEDWHDLVGVAYSTCAHAATVVRAFPESCRRRQRLTPSHHVEVASLSPRMADELLDWAEEPMAMGGQRRGVRALREEINRRQERMIPTRLVDVSETKAVTLVVEPAPAQETKEFVLIPAAAAPRHEPEVQQQLGDQASEGGSADRDAKGLALGGIYAALRKPITVELREQLQQCLRVLMQ